MLYQVGTIGSLLGGVDEGDVAVAALARYGDFGLGTFDAVNGEMIVVDGRFYRIDAGGAAAPVAPETKTPFAVMTRFDAAGAVSLETVDSLAGLEGHLSDGFESPNLIYAVRVDGAFDRVDVRSEHPQPHGHHPLSETLAQVQTSFTFTGIDGTMVGFWFPAYMGAINVPGFHFHFISADRRIGGHLFDMRLRRATLRVMPIFDFGMHLIHTPLFEHVALGGGGTTAAIDAVERKTT